MKYWIVWNENKTAGLIFDDEDTAILASSGADTIQVISEVNGNETPAVMLAFAEQYQTDFLSVQEAEL